MTRPSLSAEMQRPRWPLQMTRILGWSALFLLLVAGTFTFPYMPAHDLDQSWRMALGYFFEHRLQFGREIVFTYGPLGFVMGKAYSGLQFWSLLAGQLALALVSAGAICYQGRRVPGLSRLIFFASFLLFTIYNEDALHAPVIAILGFELLRQTGQSRPWRGVLISGVLALYAQIKFTDLLFASFVILTGLCFHLSQNRRRAALLPACSYAVVFLGIWLCCGQSLLNLSAYFHHSWQMSEGYQWAMGLPTPPAPFWKALVILAVLAGYTGLHLFVHPHKPRAVANALLLGALTFLQWKYGFVRADGHMLAFFFCVFLPLAAYPALLDDPDVLPRRTHRWVFLGVMALGVWGVEDVQRGLVRQSPEIIFAKVRDNFAAVCHWQETRQRYRDHLAQERSDIDLPLTREIVGQASIDVLGFEQGFALLNRFNYQPRPVFQSYATYLPALTKLNGDFFASAHPPSFVLMKVEAIDGRLPAMDDAQVLLLLAQRYAYVRSENDFTLWKLRSGPFDPASVQPKALRTVTLGLNDSLRIEDLNQQPLWLNIDLAPSLLGQIRRVLYKLPQVTLSIQDLSGQTHDYFLALPQGRNGFILNPLIEDQIDYRRFAGNRPEKRVRSLALRIAPGDAKFFAPAAQVVLSALPEPATQADLGPNEIRFSMFQSYPLSYDSPSGMTAQKIGGRTTAILDAPSLMVFALPAGATTISGQFGFLPGAYTNGNKTDGAQFTVYWTDGTRRIDLFQKFLDPMTWAEDRGLQHFSADLHELSGGRLCLEIGPGPEQNAACDWTGWTNILIQ